VKVTCALSAARASPCRPYMAWSNARLTTDRTVAGGRLRLLTPWLWALAGGGNAYQGRGGERRWAIAAASSRFGAPSLRRMCETCTPAVLTLMTRVAAISRLV
jgi:hypothetical protein